MKKRQHRSFPVPPHYHNVIRGICRWCNKPIVENGAINRRKTWHPSCWETAEPLLNHQAAARMVFNRDCGVCCACGLDVGKLQRDITEASFGRVRSIEECDMDSIAKHEKALGRIRHAMVSRGFTQKDFQAAVSRRRRLWEMDHITPLYKCHGQTEAHSLKNCQLLCLPCHKAKTKRDVAPR